MTCISPPEPEDWLLTAFLDDEADQDITLHLQDCSHCRDRVDALAREQKQLTSRFFRVTCPPATELGEYHLRLLPPDRTLIISKHLRDCPYCTGEIAQLGEFLSDLGPVPERGILGRAQVLIARLVGGGKASGATGEPAYALRGESAGPLTFEVGGVVIVIDVQGASDGKLNLLGQVAAGQQDDWTDATVKLGQGGQPERETTVDDLGTFRFEALIPGSMDLKIVARDGTILVVPTFEGPG